MARRPTKNRSGIRGTGAVSYNELWRVFGCARPGCDALLKVPNRTLENPESAPFLHPCSACGHMHADADATKGSVWKYCRVCEQLQPIENYHRHRRFATGRQLECKTCKNSRINAHGNPLRTRDQHREAAERRRLYVTLAGEEKCDERRVYAAFDHRCFRCDCALAPGEGCIDHTLPAMYLWPLSTGPTLLCHDCNGAKAEQWPSEFYRRGDQPDRATLQRLAVVGGIPYDVLAGTPRFNPDAVARIVRGIDEFLVRWIRYPDDIKRLRRRIFEKEGVDIYASATHVPEFLREAD